MASNLTNKHRCKCGNHKTGSFPENRQGLETSFVHLALPSWSDEASPQHHETHEQGVLETVRHASALLRAGQGKALPQNDNDLGVALCQDCIDRVIVAVDSDTERLEDECAAYEKSVVEEKERQRNLRTALLTSRSNSDYLHHGYDTESLIRKTETAFQDEIAALHARCDQHQCELQDLQSLMREQLAMNRELDRLSSCTEDQRNSMQLDARAFGHIHSHLARELQKTQNETENLSSVRIHPALFNLVVDKRGLRYPLINDLRLAYRPKGDVHWNEINAAWSQVAHLMLLIAASTSFRSKEWRIVPLTCCAKLIYLDDKRRDVFNLGGGKMDTQSDMAVALRALNILLDEMCHHTSGLIQDIETRLPVLPFNMSKSRVGSFDLSRLEPSDDLGWSRVVQCMASNLEWLSSCGSVYELQHSTLAI